MYTLTFRAFFSELVDYHIKINGVKRVFLDEHSGGVRGRRERQYSEFKRFSHDKYHEKYHNNLAVTIP
jgi:hypothetical protein